MQLVAEWQRKQAEIYEMVLSRPGTNFNRPPQAILAEIDAIVNELEGLSAEAAADARHHMVTLRVAVREWMKLWWPPGDSQA